jgi:thioredoxin reductase (NADPH)
MDVRNVIILGAGPAGYTAALYTARAGLKPLLFAGPQKGGQLMWTTEVENFPGFPEGVMGPELMQKMQVQAEKFGAEVVEAIVEEVKLGAEPFTVKTANKEYKTKTLILATGATAKWLGIPGEQEYMGKGVSACATCDGFFFRDKHVVVIGGGDAALEEATFLTKFASKVTMLVRKDFFKGSKPMQDRANVNERIEILYNREAREVLGDGQKMTGLKIVSNQTQEELELKADGVFVAIGHKPNTDLFVDQLDLAKGYLSTEPGTPKTSVEGVFAAGDVADWMYRQAITAAGSGCQAALEAERWLSHKE